MCMLNVLQTSYEQEKEALEATVTELKTENEQKIQVEINSKIIIFLMEHLLFQLFTITSLSVPVF